jgi:FlaG/FlaF family flagellin (archaellin)
MKQYTEDAVSPVVGVMLMLVVTIIIAAVVSGFSGGLMSTQTRAPQATIKATFSVTSGLAITNAGGDALATNTIVISTRDGPDFGSGLQTFSLNDLDLANVTNAAGTSVVFRNATTGEYDGYGITSFSPGDTWYVNITDCNPSLLQPTVAAYSAHGGYSFNGNTWSFSPSTSNFWALDFVNPANIGKTFYLDVSDKASGALISEAKVTITG